MVGVLFFNDRIKSQNLRDMALALKWTHDNISAFGGDPSHITVGGQSAGSVSADLLTLSPHTQSKLPSYLRIL
jgi:para-nitrobenzyl esterase